MEAKNIFSPSCSHTAEIPKCVILWDKRKVGIMKPVLYFWHYVFSWSAGYTGLTGIMFLKKNHIEVNVLFHLIEEYHELDYPLSVKY